MFGRLKKTLKDKFTLVAATLLVFAALTAFANSFSNQLFFDDEELIYQNVFVKDLRHFPKYFTTNMIAGAGKISNMYRPLLITSFALDYAFWQLNPVGFHLTNTFLHVLNTLLVFLLIKRLFTNEKIAFFTALLFSIHPVQTEAVTYVSGRTDPLSAFFILAALYAFTKTLERQSSRLVYWFSLVFYSFALLSKETAIVTPLVLLLIIFVSSKKKIVENAEAGIFTLPFFLISIVYILMRVTVFNFQNTFNFYSDVNLYSKDLIVRLLTFTGVFFQYLSVLLSPFELIMFRKATIITSLTDPFVLGFILLAGISLFFAYKVASKNKIFLFAIAWFFLWLLPVLGIIPINNIVAEHYLYLPSVSFFFLFSYVFYTVWQKLPPVIVRVFLSLALLTIVAALIYQTRKRNSDWRDPITFYTKSLTQSPWHLPMRNNLAMAYADKGRLDEAINQYQYIISVSDVYPQTHHNLANAYKEMKKYKEAEAEYKKAITLDPRFYFSYYALADLYKITGEKEKQAEIISRIPINRKTQND